MTKVGTFIAAAAAAVLLAGCAQQYEEEAPIVGWTCLPGYGHCEYGDHYRTINATVGLPFQWTFLAGCNSGQWTVEVVEIQTGRLPPGLEIASDGGPRNIVGVPTRAGSFSFQMLFRGISCPGSNYLPNGDWGGQYTIVVTGS
ncbi:MAG: hypothetical protein ACREEE_13985 [Dongiaceae bacterium]